MSHDSSITHTVTFIAPDPQAISDYARKVCSELETVDLRSGNDSVQSGFSAFLAFVANRLTKYLNDGHTELLDSYKTEKVNKGGLPCHKKPKHLER